MSIAVVDWLPILLGSDHSAGDYALTPLRIVAPVALLVSSLAAAPIVSHASAATSSIASILSACQRGVRQRGSDRFRRMGTQTPVRGLVHRDPRRGRAFDPHDGGRVVRHYPQLLVLCASTSTARSTFWMAFFHPYA